jgi:hypothetical protein
MAYGNSVIDFTQMAAGTKGYVLSVNLTDNLMKTMKGVQMTDGTTLSALYTAQASLDQLMDYAEAPNPPTVAYFQYGPSIFVFIRSDVYPFVIGSRIAFFFIRNTIPPADFVTAKLDIPVRCKDLLLAIVQRIWKNTVEKRIPFDVGENIRRQKKLLNLQ